MTYKTNGIILRAVQYGETSLIVTALTELFGLQSYIVKGVRTVSKKGASKAAFFQPGSLLEMEVYHNEHKNLNFIKEYKWAVLYEHLFSDVIKNAISLFMVELLQKTIKQPEENTGLFHFCEDAFLLLDKSTPAVMANFPLFFALQLPSLLGFQLADDFSEENHILDLQNGVYTNEMPHHTNTVLPPYSQYISELLKARRPEETTTLPLNRDIRRKLLHYLEEYYMLHLPEFTRMKTLPVLFELF